MLPKQPPSPPPLPPATADCVTAVQGAFPGATPQEFPSKILRSADGKLRIDSGTTSVITDPAARQTIILDHVTKEVQKLPMPEPPNLPQMPQAPQFAPPAAPQFTPPPVPTSTEDLGKRIIDGLEVEGKRFTAGLPAPPQMPQVPQMPQKPQVPQPPAMPAPPQVPTVSEVWTSTLLQLPVVSKIKGSFGEQICKCKLSQIAPPPAAFEIPPGYKEVKPPAPPPLPKPPATPGPLK